MKKYLAMLCATMLCVCCLALGACASGGSSSSAAASSSASASASSSAADSSAQFVGSWKLAAMETEGITMTGDLSAMLGEEMEMALTINEGGTGSMSMGADSADITWVAKDDKTIIVTPATESDESASAESASAEAASASAAATSATSIEVTYEDGALLMAMDDEGFSGTAIFTADGTYAGAAEIDASAATAITSEDALVGTWSLSGMNMMGISMYGDAESLAAMAGDSDTSIVFEKGGKVTIMGEETTYAVSADGATVAEGSETVPVKALGDDIVIDMTDMIGMQMIMVFSK